jgi:hypothetical protein
MTNPSPRSRPPGGDGGLPRWVKVTGLVLAVLVLLGVAMMLTGGFGGHGPSRHGGMGAPSRSAVTGAAHTPPAGAQE